MIKASFLIVEDSEIYRTQLVQDLNTIGFASSIIQAENLNLAVSLLNSEKIEFVICDWNLPDGKGINFLKQFRKFDELKHVPFIMCTTMDEVSNIIEAIKAGADDYVVKPWDIKELEKKIKQAYTKHHKKL